MVEWSVQQCAIFDAVVHGCTNVVAIARPGTGKTTVAVECVRRRLAVCPRDRILVSAFNRHVRDELVARLGDSPNPLIKTTNQIGYSLVRSAFHGIEFDEKKGRECAERAVIAVFGEPRTRNEIAAVGARIHAVAKLARMAKLTLASTTDEVTALSETLEDCLDLGPHDQARAVRAAGEALTFAVEDVSRCDYDDQVWLCVKYNLAPRRPYDLVIVDEAQDYSAMRWWLTLRMVAPSGRLVLFGDPEQCLMGFAGAEVDGMDRVATQVAATVLPLEETYRCPRAVVHEAQRFVPTYVWAPSAPPGVATVDVYSEAAPPVARPGDFVISRTRAPLAGLALGYAKAGLPVCIAGRDFGASLIALVRRSRTHSIAAFAEWLEDYADDLSDRLADAEEALAAALDRVGVLATFASDVKSVDELICRLDAMFGEVPTATARDRIVCATGHAVKGLETDTVYIHTYTWRRPPSKSEDRIKYVAITRAKHEVHFLILPNSLAKAQALRKGMWPTWDQEIALRDAEAKKGRRSDAPPTDAPPTDAPPTDASTVALEVS